LHESGISLNIYHITDLKYIQLFSRKSWQLATFTPRKVYGTLMLPNSWKLQRLVDIFSEF